MFKRLTIIGVGLIGGSLARAVRQVEGCREIVGCSRDQAHLQQAVDLGVIDRFETDPGRAVDGADIVVIAVPLGAMAGLFQAIAARLGPDAVITDVGSAKGSVVDYARRHLAAHLARFVPGHPIAGTERSGVTASFAGLFEDRTVILTPLAETDRQALARVRELWEMTGARLAEMTVDHHDQVLAATSHLPHLLAYSLVDTLAQMDDSEEIFTYAAGGFRDFTRIASSDPVMWRDICLNNRNAILAGLDRYNRHVSRLRQAIEQADADVILEIFSRAKAVRDRQMPSSG